MNSIKNNAALAALAALSLLALAAAPASASIRNTGPLIAPGPVWTERTATEHQNRIEAPTRAPEGCADAATNRNGLCPNVASISRNKTPVRMIPIYTVTPVAVCAPDATNDCTARR